MDATPSAALLLLLRPHHHARRAVRPLALVAAGASVSVAFVFSLDAYASPGTWIASFDELFFLAIGAGVLLRGADRWHLPAAIGIGLLAIAVGVSKGAIFFHAIVLAVVPGALSRLLVITALDAGLAAAVLGGVSYTDTLRMSGVETRRPSSE